MSSFMEAFGNLHMDRPFSPDEYDPPVGIEGVTPAETEEELEYGGFTDVRIEEDNNYYS